MIFITTGPSEFYRLRNDSTVRNISSGIGGQFSAILSTDLQSASFEISLWMNRFGMVCVGGSSFEASTNLIQKAETNTAILWHSRGNNLCVLVDGNVIFLKISCFDRKSKKEISLGDANIEYSLNGSGNNSTPSVASNNLAIELKEMSRHSLNASSICQTDNGRCLLIGCRGVIVKYSWKGNCISSVHTNNTHSLHNTWQHGSFSLIKNDFQLNGNSSVDTILKRSETEEESEDESKMNSETDVITSCSHSDSKCFSSLLLADGSIVFLDNSSGIKEKIASAGYSTSKIHLVMLLNTIKKTTTKKQASTVVIDSSKIVDVNQGLLDGIYEQAISRVTNMCLIDSYQGLEHSGLLVVTILTRHLPFNGPDAHIEEDRPCIGRGRETLTLNVIRIGLKSTDILGGEQYVELQCMSTVLLQSQSPLSPTQNNINSKNDDTLCDQHSMVLMHGNESGVMGQGLMVLITVKGEFSL